MNTKSRFFWTRNNGGAVLPVGETRRSADFYVSADLTRPSERRLQADFFLRFEELRSRFHKRTPADPKFLTLLIGPRGGADADANRHAVSDLDGSPSRGCHARHSRGRRASTCESRTKNPIATPLRSRRAASAACGRDTVAESEAGAAVRPPPLPSLLLLLLARSADYLSALGNPLPGKSRAQARRRRLEKNCSARRRRRNFGHHSLREDLVHDGLPARWQ